MVPVWLRSGLMYTGPKNGQIYRLYWTVSTILDWSPGTCSPGNLKFLKWHILRFGKYFKWLPQRLKQILTTHNNGFQPRPLSKTNSSECNNLPTRSSVGVCNLGKKSLSEVLKMQEHERWVQCVKSLKKTDEQKYRPTWHHITYSWVHNSRTETTQKQKCAENKTQ
jgi:hypothetical protein